MRAFAIYVAIKLMMGFLLVAALSLLGVVSVR